MRVLLVYPNIVESPKDISLGLASISAVLKQKGHEVKLLDSTFGLSDTAIVGTTRNFTPDLVGITAASNDYSYAKHVARLIKSNTDAPLICGGFHPTIAPEEVVREKEFDMICIGEGEHALLELVNDLPKKKPNYKIKNIWFRKNGKVIKNPVRPLIKNLNSLPHPDRELFDYQKYIDWHNGVATFVSTRGCPFQCSYCINHLLQKLYAGKGTFVRFKSINRLLDEIKQVISKYNTKEIGFNDDTFTLNYARVKEFCEKYTKEIGLPFYINARVNAVTKEMFDMLAKAGCKRVSIGLESGDPYIRNQILRRNMTDEQIISTFNWAKAAGLEVYSFNMIGAPYETRKTIQRTIELNRRVRPDYVGASIFNAYKGTEAYELCKSKNWLTGTDVASYFQSTNVKHPNFSPDEFKKVRDCFGYEVYKKMRPIRAMVDLIDKYSTRFSPYVRLRSNIIKSGIRKFLRTS